MLKKYSKLKFQKISGIFFLNAFAHKTILNGYFRHENANGTRILGNKSFHEKKNIFEIFFKAKKKKQQIIFVFSFFGS